MQSSCFTIRWFQRQVLVVIAALGALGLVSSVVAAPTRTNAPTSFFPPPPDPRQPNIVLIVADDLGYGDLGCYGQKKIKTPNIDKLASEGMRFTSFYAGSTVCSPSRAALMLGKHTGHLEIRGNANQSLRADDVTLAESLQDAGYRTGLVGKWGLGGEGSEGVPQKQGFYEFAGYLENRHAHDYYSEYIWRFDPYNTNDGKVFLPQNLHGARGLYLPDQFTEAALNFIRIYKPEPFNKYRPFFLLYATTIPHANSGASPTNGNAMPVPNDKPYSDEDWPQAEKNKAAMITRLDADVGRLMERLEKLKIASDTVVIFTSDNGPHSEGGIDPKFFESAGPFRGQKRDLTEGGIRVPLIIRWPGEIKPGSVNNQPWAIWDLFPTLVEMAHTNPPAKLDGISMLPALLGRAQTNRHEYLYWEFHEKGFSQAIRVGDWKLIRNGVNAKPELYDMKKDPGETNNVASANASVVAKLQALMKTARTDSKAWPITKTAEKQSSQVADKAKSSKP